jgi:hypothetical protein
MLRRKAGWFFCITLLVTGSLTFAQTPGPGAVIVDNPPKDFAYWHGCSPTSAGMLFGYWEEHGYDSFPGSHRDGPDNWMNTDPPVESDYADARGVIAGWAHSQAADGRFGSYNGHAPDSLADFMLTHRGSTSGSSFVHGFETFGAWDDPRTGPIESRKFIASYNCGSYNDYVAEIDAGRPVMLSLIADSPWNLKHSVIGVGYNNTDGKQNYILYESSFNVGLQEWDWQDGLYNYRVVNGVKLIPDPDPAPQLSGYFSIAHTNISDLTVELGVGDHENPDWSTAVWNGSGGSSDNLVLTDIDITAMLDEFLADELTWYLKVTDGSGGNTGSILDFQIRYGFDEIVFGYEGDPVSVDDFGTSHVYVTTPEPASTALMAIGGIILLRRRRRH